ncbi:fatty acyl-CoA synthetase [Monashia sp. NPDC004114]
MNDTMGLRARQHGLGDLTRRSAARFPHKLAIQDGAVRLTFADLDGLVNRTCHTLLDRGLRKGDRCAILSHNNWQFAVLSFATARLGLVLVPINFMLTAVDVAYILDHSGADVVVVEDVLTGVAEAAIASRAGSTRLRAAIGSPVAGWEPFDDWTAHGDDSPVDVFVDDDDPIRLMYTSGTESRPKGVLLTSRSLLWQYATCVIDGGMESDDVELHSLPLYHCAQLDCFLGPDVYLGASSIITSTPEPGNLLRLIEQHRVTKFFAPPTVWISLLRSPEFERTDLSSLRKGYYGASAMPAEILRELAERLPGIRLWNFYGQTEMSPLATILKPHEQLAYAGAAGRPAINVETMIVDAEARPLPAGKVGEIVHRGPHAMQGYYNDPDRTGEAFRGGWFHSGDLGVFDEDGVLRVVDRVKDMIKTGGENVASREVEEVIYTLEGVAEVAVFGVPDPLWIEAVAAAVVPKPGAHLSPESLIGRAREQLAGFKTPKRVLIVDALPKNPSGKILKRELRERFAREFPGE